MNLSALSAVFSKPTDGSTAATDPRNAIPESNLFTSKRFLTTAACVVGLYFIGHTLPGAVLTVARDIVIVYLITEAVAKAVTVASNAWIRTHEVKADVEFEKMRDPATGKLPWEPRP
jgi:hypothetical protein